MKAPRWRIRGEWQDSCSCDIGCPCTFDQLPTLGYCQGLLAYHIEKGNFGELSLNNLNMVSVGKYGQGRLLAGHWVVGYVFDEKANSEQREALRKIFMGEAGGRFGMLRPLIAKVVGIEYAPIVWRHDRQRWGIKIGENTQTKSGVYRGLDVPKGGEVRATTPPVPEVGMGIPFRMGRTSRTRCKSSVSGFVWPGQNASSGLWH